LAGNLAGLSRTAQRLDRDEDGFRGCWLLRSTASPRAAGAELSGAIAQSLERLARDVKDAQRDQRDHQKMLNPHRHIDHTNNDARPKVAFGFTSGEIFCGGANNVALSY
jgi:hypothetical protein